MSKRVDQSKEVTRWRRIAEEKIRENTCCPSVISVPQSVEETQKLIYELQIHQIELEMQNEELQRAKEELDSSRQHYLNLYDLAPVGYVTVDRDGIILKTNLAATSILERFREDLLGQSIYQTIYHEDQDIFYFCRKKLLETSEPQICELRMVKKDGTTVWVSLTCSTAQFESESFSYLIVLSDITDRKDSEEALKENEQRYEKAQRIGKIGSWEYDLKTRKIWGSEEAKSIYGYDPQKEFFTTKEVESCIPDRQRVHQALVNLIENEQPYNLEFEIQPLAGPEKKYIKSIAEVVVNESGTPVKVDGVILDITSLKLVDEKLRKSEEKYRQLFQSIKDGILVTDTDRNIIDCNQTFREWFGYTKEEILGKQTGCLYESEEEFLKMGKRIKHYHDLGEKQFSYNINYKKKSGEIFPGETNASYLVNDKDETVGFIGIIRDITHRKMVEKSLQKANEELKQKTLALEDTNTALKVLLAKRDQDNLELEENIYSNYEILITPFLSKLKNRSANINQQNLLDIVEANLKEIIAPFAKKLSSSMMSLTSSEIQIVSMIKQGFTNKEIAQTLNCSKRTIDTHRENIRKKLNLTNQKLNLKTFLLNL